MSTDYQIREAVRKAVEESDRRWADVEAADRDCKNNREAFGLGCLAVYGVMKTWSAHRAASPPAPRYERPLTAAEEREGAIIALTAIAFVILTILAGALSAAQSPRMSGIYSYQGYFHFVRWWLGVGFCDSMTSWGGPGQCFYLAWRVVIGSYVALAVVPAHWLLRLIARNKAGKTMPVLWWAWAVALVLPQAVICCYSTISAFWLEDTLLAQNRDWYIGCAVVAVAACLAYSYFAGRAKTPKKAPGAASAKRNPLDLPPPKASDAASVKSVLPEPFPDLLAKAEAGDARAQFLVAAAYAEALDVAKDLHEAIKWCRKSAEQGYTTAQYYLGMLYYGDGDGYGDIFVKDRASAAHWFLLAADGNHEKAQYMIGRMLANGDGVKKDGDEGMGWLPRAAEQRHNKARFVIGTMYFKGNSVPRDSVGALAWWNLFVGNDSEYLDARRRAEIDAGPDGVLRAQLRSHELLAQYGEPEAEY